MMNEFWGRVHFWGSLVFMNLVFQPMFAQGMAGMLRRMRWPAPTIPAGRDGEDVWWCIFRLSARFVPVAPHSDGSGLPHLCC